MRQKTQSRLSQKDIEVLNQALDKVRKLNQRWDKRLTFDSLKLQERFDSRELRILAPFGEASSGKRGLIVFEPVAPKESLTFTENITSDGYESSVFIYVVKFREQPERIVPAFIRLESINEMHSSWFNDSLYFSTCDGFISMNVFANRETGLSESLQASLRIANKSKLINGMVKRTPKVVQHISSNGKHLKTNNGQFHELRRSLGEFRVILGTDNLSVGVPVGLRQRFQFGEVLFGPFNLYPDSDKSFFGAQRHER